MTTSNLWRLEYFFEGSDRALHIMSSETLRHCLDLASTGNMDRYAATHMLHHHWRERSSFTVELWGPNGSGKNAQLEVWCDQISKYAHSYEGNINKRYWGPKRTYFLKFDNSDYPRNISVRDYTHRFFQHLLKVLGSTFFSDSSSSETNIWRDSSDSESTTPSSVLCSSSEVETISPEHMEGHESSEFLNESSLRIKLRKRRKQVCRKKINFGLNAFKETDLSDDDFGGLSDCSTNSRSQSSCHSDDLFEKGHTHTLRTNSVVRRLVAILERIFINGEMIVICLSRMDLCLSASQKILYGILTHMADASSSVLLITTVLHTKSLSFEKRIYSRYNPFHVAMFSKVDVANLSSALNLLLPQQKIPSNSTCIAASQTAESLTDSLQKAIDSGQGFSLLQHCADNAGSFSEICSEQPLLAGNNRGNKSKNSKFLVVRRVESNEKEFSASRTTHTVSSSLVALLDPGFRSLSSISLPRLQESVIGGAPVQLLCHLSSWINRVRKAVYDCIILAAAAVLSWEQAEAYYHKHTVAPASSSKDTLPSFTHASRSARVPMQGALKSPPLPFSSMCFTSCSVLRIIASRDGGMFPMCAPSFLDSIVTEGKGDERGEYHSSDSVLFSATWDEWIHAALRDVENGEKHTLHSSHGHSSQFNMWYESLGRLTTELGLLSHFTGTLLFLTLPPTQTTSLVVTRLYNIVSHVEAQHEAWCASRYRPLEDVSENDRTQLFTRRLVSGVLADVKEVQKRFVMHSESTINRMQQL